MLADLPPDLGFAARPATPADAPLLEPLADAIGRADGSPEHLTVDDLVDELSASWVDLAADSVVVTAADGTAAAWGLVQVRPGDTTLLRVTCDGGVRPDLRGRGIGRALLGWQLARATQLAAARRAELAGDGGAPVPAWASVSVEDGAPATARLAERLGLRPVRWFTTMSRPLEGASVPEAAPPAGVRLAPWTADRDEAVRLAHNVAFTDHWSFQPWTPETWQQWQTGHRSFRPDWSVVALDEGGEIAGYALNAAYEQDWPAQGRTEGWTNKLGVLPAWRGRGLATALLARSMAAFAESGMQAAGLDVDTENISGAVALYERLGYRAEHRSATWTLDV